MVSDLRRFAESGAEPRVLVVFQASVDAGRTFFSERWPGVTAIADPERVLYTAFGRGRGGLAELASPRVFVRALRSLLRGHFVGRPVGDPRIMPGLFLIRDGRVLREHGFADAGDHPDLEAFCRAPTLA